MTVRDDYERVRDERREYLAHVLSRTKRKDFENYVVNAVWQRLADPYLQPETQRYVRRDNGYALIDLYFPAVNVGVECDEAYHLGDTQRMSDKQREEEIAARLNSVDGSGDYLACHVRAFGTFEQMEYDINQAVRAINRRKRELAPEPWMPGRPPWEVAIERGSIRVGDGLSFHTIADVCRCFSRNYKRMQKCYFSLSYAPYYLWCPKLGIEMSDGSLASAAFNYTNSLAIDGSAIYAKSSTRKAGPGIPDRHLVTFARGKDELGKTAYRFVGVFRDDGPKPDDPWTGIHNRIDTEIDLRLGTDRRVMPPPRPWRAPHEPCGGVARWGMASAPHSRLRLHENCMSGGVFAPPFCALSVMALRPQRPHPPSARHPVADALAPVGEYAALLGGDLPVVTLEGLTDSPVPHLDGD